jgi:hypothetical protein
MVMPRFDFYSNEARFWNQNQLLGYVWLYPDCLGPGAQDQYGIYNDGEVEDFKQEFGWVPGSSHVTIFQRNRYPELLW